MAGTVGFQNLVKGYLVASRTTGPLVPPSHPFDKVSLEISGEQIGALLTRNREQAALFGRLGFDPEHPDKLHQALIAQARNHPCIQVEELEHDIRFVIRGTIEGPQGSADIDSLWLMEKYGTPPTARLEAVHIPSKVPSHD